MSINFFNDVLAALGKRLNFESISNLYGNGLCKDANKYISQANPLQKAKQFNSGFMNIINESMAKQNVAVTKEQKQAQAKATLGDTSWAEGLFD